MSQETMGHLKIILGPMFSEKSTYLIREYKRCEAIGQQILAINYIDDDRYSNDDEIVNHNNSSISCIKTKELMPLLETLNLDDYAKILIDESQFFDDLVEFVQHVVDIMHKHVVVAGLDGDWRRQAFGHTLELIPFCDEVHKLHALCLVCRDGTKAIFSKKISGTSETAEIGSSETYSAVCRRHFCSI
jgi:thymidine kinase